MACGNCKKEPVIDLTRSGLEYVVASGISSVVGSDSTAYAIGRPLIFRPHSPRGGWKVVFYIKGQETIVSGPNPPAVFKEVKRLFRLNEIEFTDLSIWFNLNLQWLKRAIVKYQVVKFEDLEAIAIPA